VAQHVDTIATGVPQLDLLLGGGIVRNSMVLVVGPSGVGKTVLASQMACTAANHGDPVVIVTTFSEPHNKLIRNLENFQFFQRNLVGERIKLINIQHQLVSSLDDAANTIVREAREHSARFVLLDGFQGIRLSSTAPTAPYHFLHDLGAKLHLLGVTTIVMCEIHDAHEAHLAEFTLADTVIAIAQHVASNRSIRTLEIIKQRGMHPLLGQHPFTLSDGGIRCYPRQETLPIPALAPSWGERLSTGLPSLDMLLDGGIPQRSSTLITGPSGTGMTTLGLHYALHGAVHGAPAVFVTFGEPSEQVLAKARVLGIDISPTEQSHIQIQSYALAGLDPDIVAGELRETIEQYPGARVVLDGAHHLARLFSNSERGPSFFTSLIAWLQAHDATVLFTSADQWTAGGTLHASLELAMLIDNLIILNNNDQGQGDYILGVVKMRGSNHDRTRHTYTIGAGGITLDIGDNAGAKG
jgi:circadian clock protein KaiC